MDLCNHGGVTIEADENGFYRVAYAAHAAAFPREWLNAADPQVATVDGNRITVCGEAVYEVTDWHHRCASHEHADTVLARLVSRPPQPGDVEILLKQALKPGHDDLRERAEKAEASNARVAAIHPSREEADAAENALCPECVAPAPCKTRRALDGESPTIEVTYERFGDIWRAASPQIARLVDHDSSFEVLDARVRARMAEWARPDVRVTYTRIE